MAYLKKTVCLLCNHEATPHMGGIAKYWYCNNCFLGWLKKLPHTVYDETYYIGKSNFASKIFYPIAQFFYFVRRSYVGLDEKNIWIDCGAGDGGFLRTVSAKKRIGVEISSSGRKMMKEIGLLTLDNNQFLKSKGIKADVISFWHVIEHLKDPIECLNAVHKNLNDNGELIIGIPNHDSFEFKFFKTNWFHLVPKYHLWHFSPRSIGKLLDKTGFKASFIDYWSIEHHPTGILQSFINKSAGSDSVLHRLVKRGLNYSPNLKDMLWSIFWLSAGLPIVLLFWIFSAIFHQSGTIVVVASKK